MLSLSIAFRCSLLHALALCIAAAGGVCVFVCVCLCMCVWRASRKINEKYLEKLPKKMFVLFVCAAYLYRYSAASFVYFCLCTFDFCAIGIKHNLYE